MPFVPAGGREPGSGNVEKTVKINAHGGIEDTPQQKQVLVRRFVPLQTPHTLMDGVGEGEGVLSRVPVTELVARVEAGNAQRRGISDRAGKFNLTGSCSQRLQQRVNNGLRIIAEQYRHQSGSPRPAAALGSTSGESIKNLRAPIAQQIDQIDGIAPRIGLLHAPCRCIARHQAGQNCFRLFPTDDIQRFEGLVGKVQWMSDIDIAEICCCAEQNICHLLRTRAGL